MKFARVVGNRIEEFVFYSDDGVPPDLPNNFFPVRVEGLDLNIDQEIFSLRGPTFTIKMNSREVIEQYTTEFNPNARQAMTNKVDQMCSAYRGLFITNTPDQSMVYDYKYREAIDCVENYSPDNLPPAGKYPWLDREVGITGPTVYRVAKTIKEKGDQWRVIGYKTEQYRLAKKREIMNAPNDGKAYAIFKQVDFSKSIK